MKVIINKIEYAYERGSVQIDQQLGSRSTARVTILHDVNTHFARGTQVEIQTDLGTAIFRGFISPSENIKPDLLTMRTQIDCVDFHYAADKRTISASAFSSQPAGTTVTAIVADPLAAEGITAGTIEAGETFPILDLTKVKVSSALQDLAEGCGFIWWIDINKALHFRAPGNQPAPWGLVWENIQLGSLEVARVSRDYKNRVRVRGTDAIANNTTEQTRLAAIEGGSGIVEDVLEGTGYASEASAQAVANSVVATYSKEETMIKFDTRKAGLDIGQTVTAQLPEHSIDGTAFLITAVSIREDYALDNAGILYTVDAINGPTSSNWASRVGRLMSRGEAIDKLARRFVAADLQEFTATGVWAKPTVCASFEIWFFSGGGGGGGGARGNGTNRGGGGGGGGGSVMYVVIDAKDLANTENVTIPTGTVAGAGATVADTNGVSGSTGSSPEGFGWKLFGGTGGTGGTTSGASGGSGGSLYTQGLNVGNASETAGTGTVTGTGGTPSASFHYCLPTGGGGGGGAAGTFASPGGVGGGYFGSGSGPLVRPIGGAAGAAFQAGFAGVAGVETLEPGTGGGGGGSCSTLITGAGAGGVGGFPGGGGGGGGGGTNAIGNGAAGGNGGAAKVVIIGR